MIRKIIAVVSVCLFAATAWAQLTINDLSGFGIGGVEPFSCAYVTSTSSNTNSSSVTFTAHSIGAADSTRRVVVAVGWSSSTGANQTLNSMTVGGSAATRDIRATASAVGHDAEIYSILVPTGTTADIVLNYSGSINRHVVHVYRCVNEVLGFDQSGLADPGVATSATTGSISVAALSWLIAVHSIRDTTDASTFDDGVDDNSGAISAGSNAETYAGSREYATAATATVSTSVSVNSNRRIAAASYR